MSEYPPLPQKFASCKCCACACPSCELGMKWYVATLCFKEEEMCCKTTGEDKNSCFLCTRQKCTIQKACVFQECYNQCCCYECIFSLCCNLEKAHSRAPAGTASVSASRVGYPEPSEICLINGYCCALQGLICGPSCLGCVGHDQCLCLDQSMMCYKFTGEQQQDATDKTCCILSKNECMCVPVKTCCLGEMQCCCNYSAWALPCTDLVPCTLGYCGLFCFQNFKPDCACCQKMDKLYAKMNPTTVIPQQTQMVMPQQGYPQQQQGQMVQQQGQMMVPQQGYPQQQQQGQMMPQQGYPQQQQQQQGQIMPQQGYPQQQQQGQMVQQQGYQQAK